MTLQLIHRDRARQQCLIQAPAPNRRQAGVTAKKFCPASRRRGPGLRGSIPSPRRRTDVPDRRIRVRYSRRFLRSDTRAVTGFLPLPILVDSTRCKSLIPCRAYAASERGFECRDRRLTDPPAARLVPSVKTRGSGLGKTQRSSAQFCSHTSLITSSNETLLGTTTKKGTNCYRFGHSSRETEDCRHRSGNS